MSVTSLAGPVGGGGGGGVGAGTAGASAAAGTVAASGLSQSGACAAFLLASVAHPASTTTSRPKAARNAEAKPLRGSNTLTVCGSARLTQADSESRLPNPPPAAIVLPGHDSTIHCT